ncbi:hypothetical protein B0H11DRAFT_2370554 [Mycena galericulata]|nr:hypothetical protein B0H11DRAFT_2370554 [Mycena galericulata]
MMFAQELMDMILEQLKAASDTTETFKSFSLVAHRFLAPCQRHLFRRLTAERLGIEELSWILEDAPHIASYVLDLTIDFNIGERGTRLGVRDSDVHVALESIFTVLCNVRRLTLSSWSAWTTDSLAADVKSSFIRFLSLPSLQALSFLNGVYPRVPGSGNDGVPSCLILYALSSYKEVTLGPALKTHHDDRFISLPPAHSSPPLQKLDVYCHTIPSPPLRSLLLSPEVAPSTANLQHLRLTIDNPAGNLGGYQNLACVRNIQHLELDLPGTPYQPISLPALPHVLNLTIRVPIPTLDSMPNTLLATLAPLPARAPRLTTIRFVLLISARPAENYAGLARPVAGADAALAALPHLREATFSADAAPAAMALFARSVETQLPLARDAGRLAFEAR